MQHPARTPKVLAPGEGKAVMVLGDAISFKMTGEETGGAYCILEVVSPPEGGPPRHVHSREDEAFYILEGSFEFQVDGRKIAAGAGSFVFGPRDVPHTFKNVGSAPGKMLLVVQPAGIEKFFEQISLLPPGPPDFAKIAALAGEYGIAFV